MARAATRAEAAIAKLNADAMARAATRAEAAARKEEKARRRAKDKADAEEKAKERKARAKATLEAADAVSANERANLKEVFERMSVTAKKSRETLEAANALHENNNFDIEAIISQPVSDINSEEIITEQILQPNTVNTVKDMLDQAKAAELKAQAEREYMINKIDATEELIKKAQKARQYAAEATKAAKAARLDAETAMQNASKTEEAARLEAEAARLEAEVTRLDAVIEAALIKTEEAEEASVEADAEMNNALLNANVMMNKIKRVSKLTSYAKYLQYGRGNDPSTNLLQTAKENITKLKLPKELLPLIEKLIETYHYTDLKSIFETILRGFDYIKENYSQRKSMPKEFKKLIEATDGIELVKQLHKYPSNILDKIKLDKLEQSIDGQLIKYQTINHPNNALLDDVIKKAILSTLGPRQKSQLDPIIKTIDTSMDKLQPYTTDECIIYNKLNTEKIKDFIRQITASNKYGEVRKACKYIEAVRPKFKSLSGGSLESNTTYINIKDILKENPQQEINLKCSITSDNTCKFCNKFTTEKTNFKKLVGKMVKKDDMMEVLELMNASVDLLPVAILDKNEFHKFHIAMQEYKQSKKSQ